MKWVTETRNKSRLTNSILVGFLGLGIWFLLSTANFTDLNTLQKRDNEILGPFDDQAEYIQGFISKQPYLALVELSVLSRGYSHKGEFEIKVQLENEYGGLIASRIYKVPESPQTFVIRLPIRPQRDSLNKKYYLRISTNVPPGSVFLPGSDYDSYSGGGLINKNEGSSKGDLAFYTHSRPPPYLVLFDTIQQSSGKLLTVILTGLAYFALGAVVTRYFLDSDDILEIIGFSLVIGVAIPPIALFLLSIFGIKLTMANSVFHYVWVLVALCLLSAYLLRRRGSNFKESPINIFSTENLFIISMFILACLTRLAQTADILVPNGIGSFTHLKLLERIDRNGIVPLDSIYHLGFHSNAMFVHWLTKESLPGSSLILGIFLSILAGLSFHLLARRVFKDTTPALIATGFYWFISPIPGSLINGDRLPFLQGITLLPAAIALIWDAYQSRREIKALGSLLLVSLFLSHYSTVIVLAGLLSGIYFYRIFFGNSRKLEKGRLFSILIFSAPLALALVAKAYYVINEGSLGQFLHYDPSSVPVTDYEYIFKNTYRNGGWILWGFGIPGAAVLIHRNSRLLSMVTICAFALFGLNWIQFLLAGHSVSRPKNILYFLSIPLALGAGFLLDKLSSNNKRINLILISLLIFAGSYNISAAIEPRNVFYSQADQEAVNWIRNNLSPGSSILINSHPWDGIYKPTDGGGWIPYLTGSKTIFPGTSAQYDEIEDFVRQTGVEYIYLSSGYGDLTPTSMNKIPNTLLYKKDGIYIYQVLSR